VNALYRLLAYARPHRARLVGALALLRQMDEFSQSRFRLESRYHHVLVDEFQDTSRAQWELVSLLIQSWGEGLGLPTEPSIFIVGDRKQSIYRFRDAEVAVLQEAGKYIEGLRAGGNPRRSITRSFRALPELLSFVNDLAVEGAAAPEPELVQEWRAAPVRNLLEAPAQRVVASRSWEESSRQRTVVEACTANDNRQAAARLNVSDDLRRVARVLRRCVHLGGFGNVDQVMGNGASIGISHLVGADVEPAIDRGRVAVDNLALERFGERKRQGALPGCRRTEDGDDDRLRHRSDTERTA